MIGRFHRVMSVVLLTAHLLAADAQDHEPLVGQADSATAHPASMMRDIVFFYREYPVFIRLHIEVDGNSFEESWREYVRSILSELDADGDERLTVEEIAGWSASAKDRPAADVLRLARDPELWSADRDPLDQAITMDELTTFLVRRRRGPFQAPDAVPEPVSGAAVGATLFQLLDRNTDQGLSADELTQAMASLHRRDLDDDGTLGVAELSPSSSPFAARNDSAATTTTAPFVTLSPGVAPLHVLRELERRYASAPLSISAGRTTFSRELRQDDLRLSAATFAALDFDSDGTLNRDELRELVRNPPPTVELIIRLGLRAANQSVVNMIDSVAGEDISVRRSADGLTSVVFGDVQVEIAETAAGPAVAKQYLLRQFDLADRDGNNYLEREEALRNDAFRAAFDQFDEDGDGKLFREELSEGIEGHTRAAECRTRMEVRNRGRDLFQILDIDRNRLLGRRELAEAVRRIQLWDADGNGCVSESEIPQIYQISFGPGQPEFRGVQIPGQAVRLTKESNSSNPAAPRWFKKLDRNGDGELARREFPGPSAEFQKLDQNSDGAVDAAEAELVR